MNLKTSLVLIAFGCAFGLCAQTNQPPVDAFVLVTNLWYQGYKTNVLAIAEQRLAANSNDLAGLVIKMEYDAEYMNTDCFSNNIFALQAAIGSIATNTFFFKEVSSLSNELTNMLEILATEFKPTPEEIENDRAKANIIHKPMTYEVPLKALHDDGLF